MDIQTLRPAIDRILRYSDFEAISTRKIRQELLVFYPDLDIKKYKAEIDSLTLELFHQLPPPPPKPVAQPLSTASYQSPSGSASPPSTAQAKKSSSFGKKRPKVEESGSGEKKPAPTGGFNKPHRLSAELAAIVGEQVMSRPQVTKQLWAYIKANNLQEPTDRRVINCDEKLQRVFGRQVGMFSLAKIMGNHLFPVNN